MLTVGVSGTHLAVVARQSQVADTCPPANDGYTDIADATRIKDTYVSHCEDARLPRMILVCPFGRLPCTLAATPPTGSMAAYETPGGGNNDNFAPSLADDPGLSEPSSADPSKNMAPTVCRTAGNGSMR